MSEECERDGSSIHLQIGLFVCFFVAHCLFVCLLLILCLVFLLKLSLLLNKHMQYNLVFGGQYNYMDVFEVKMSASFRHNTEASDSHIVRF